MFFSLFFFVLFFKYFSLVELKKILLLQCRK